MAAYRFLILDVFTDVPLAGNQLAVFPDARDIPEDRLQPLAREIGFSETVFAYDSQGDGDVRIRIFTPGTELPFAGHPVLGSAIALASPDRDEIRIETLRATVPVRLDRAGHAPYGWMIQPIPSVAPFPEAERLLAAVGVAASTLPVEVYDNGPRFVYVALGSAEAVAGLAPDMAAIARVAPDIGVSCFAPDGARWKTRMFFPSGGVSEDPATGSAAGPLGVHLARHGRIAFGERIEIGQGAEVGRPSTLYVQVDGSLDRIERVGGGGYAVLVGRGEFDLA